MSSLHVPGSQRARSHSRSGSVRERSRSRDSRAPSPMREKPRNSSKKYYDSDSTEEEEQPRHSSSRLTKTTYDDLGSEAERYQRSHKVKNPPGYYVSDEEDTARKYSGKYQSEDHERRYAGRDHRYARPARHGNHGAYSDSLTDSDDDDDDGLAYGDSHYDNPRASKIIYGPDAMKESFKSQHPRAKSPYRSQGDRVSGGHPSYAQPQSYSYADPTQYYRGYSAEQEKDRYGSREKPLPSDWAEIPECERPDFVPPTTQPPLGAYATPDPSLIPTTRSRSPAPLSHYAPISGHSSTQHYAQLTSGATETSGHRRGRSTSSVPVPQQQYATPAPYQYAQVDPNIKYTSKSSSHSYRSDKDQQGKPYTMAAEPQFVEIRPEKSSKRPHSLSVNSGNDHMAVPGSFPESDRPPASPLLEPYQGTYQTISPMPWPMKRSDDDDLSELELSAVSGSERSKSKKDKSKKKDSKTKPDKKTQLEKQVQDLVPSEVAKKRVTFYDAKPDAKLLKSALSHSRINPKPLLTILPYLTSDEVLDLRAEYKNLFQLTGKGINIAKHIKVQVPGNLGKVCYATALGRWESEAHWANFWYRSNSLRRELLIESLIGRTNPEIREIKKAFRDKRYGDDLEKCMKAELKADKFRMAILLALEERRQSDSAKLDMELIHHDVKYLHRALISREGGETAMIQIIVVRSDTHLREVMHEYEYVYQKNFAREMIAKSRNLVGETLAHILNGALNRPMRDALLLHQAISESGPGRDRAELLISRLVRMHWEPRHLERVKHEYRRRYGLSVEEAIEEDIMQKNRSEWVEFCIELVKSSRVLVANGSA